MPIRFSTNDTLTSDYVLSAYYAYDDGVAEYGGGTKWIPISLFCHLPHGAVPLVYKLGHAAMLLRIGSQQREDPHDTAYLHINNAVRRQIPNREISREHPKAVPGTIGNARTTEPNDQITSAEPPSPETVRGYSACESCAVCWEPVTHDQSASVVEDPRGRKKAIGILGACESLTGLGTK